MVDDGREFAAAKIQGLVRGARDRSIVSSIWRKAEEFAMDVVRGEREAKIKRDAERRAKEKVRSFASLINSLCGGKRHSKFDDVSGYHWSLGTQKAIHIYE